MPVLFTLDYNHPRGQVRLLIGDIDADNAIFDDEAIDTFLALASGDGVARVRRAAAQALLTIAASEVYVLKVIRLLDVQTDGAAVARELRQQAKELMDQAEEEEVIGAFDWAEQVNNPAQYVERLWKERLRG